MLRLVVTLLALAVGADALCSGYGSNCVACAGNDLCYFNAATNSCAFGLPILVDKADVINEPFDCPVPTPASFPYSDDFGRNRAFLYSAASNGENQAEVQKCLDHAGTVFHRQHTLPCDLIGSNCSAYLAVNEAEKAIVLAFRGTKGSNQFYSEAFNLLTYGSTTSEYVEGKVFSYFSKAFDKLWEGGVQADLEDLKTLHPDYELWTFGHSLGGSLASIAATAAVEGGLFTSSKVKSVTLGQPRTGDLTFAIHHDANVPQSYRIIKATDLIPKLPFKILPGQPNAYHHRFEVWYNNAMAADNVSFVVNNRADDWSGANSETNLQDSTSHLTYFNEDIDNYYLTKC